jgi:hypothetical protein
MKLSKLLLEILNEASIEQLQQQFVDTNKISAKDFENIKQATEKGAYATWLVKKVIDKIIKSEDVYKFKDYFAIFDKYKNQFPLKDVSAYQTKEQVKDFISKAVEIKNKIADVSGEAGSSNNLVSPQGVKALESIGIKFLGLVEGYQCFKIPQELSGNENAWKVYRKYLAKCGGRKEGEGIEICTMANQEYFDEYLETNDLYVFFNMNDKRSPYQFHYGGRGEEDQFMDKNNISLFDIDEEY